MDKLFTGTIVFGLVSSAYLSYYLRPWRWMAFRRTKSDLPDNPYTGIPLPEAGSASAKSDSKSAEKAVA